MKLTRKIAASDEMIAIEEGQVELDDEDWAIVRADEDGETFLHYFERRYEELMSEGSVLEIAAKVMEETDLRMQWLGHPAAHAKIVAISGETRRWEPAGKEWSEGIFDSDSSKIGTYGYKYWFGSFERPKEITAEYKLTTLYRAALELVEAETEAERVEASFRFGTLRERYVNHDRHIANVRTGVKVRSGGSRSAEKTNRKKREETDRRLELLDRAVFVEGKSVLQASRDLAANGFGSVAANLKLWDRSRRIRKKK